jgi:antitoxin (DNA-binding transcriptional repressor) of toxin-antitoxin stability system
MSVREFRARCLEVLASDADEHVVVKSTEQPVARVVPMRRPRRKLHRPSLAKYVIFSGDVETPVSMNWESGDW